MAHVGAIISSYGAQRFVIKAKIQSQQEGPLKLADVQKAVGEGQVGERKKTTEKAVATEMEKQVVLG